MLETLEDYQTNSTLRERKVSNGDSNDSSDSSDSNDRGSSIKSQKEVMGKVEQPQTILNGGGGGDRGREGGGRIGTTPTMKDSTEAAASRTTAAARMNRSAKEVRPQFYVLILLDPFGARDKLQSTIAALSAAGGGGLLPYALITNESFARRMTSMV